MSKEKELNKQELGGISGGVIDPFDLMSQVAKGELEMKDVSIISYVCPKCHDKVKVYQYSLHSTRFTPDTLKCPKCKVFMRYDLTP